MVIETPGTPPPFDPVTRPEIVIVAVPAPWTCSTAPPSGPRASQPARTRATSSPRTCGLGQHDDDPGALNTFIDMLFSYLAPREAMPLPIPSGFRGLAVPYGLLHVVAASTHLLHGQNAGARPKRRSDE